MKNTLFLKYDTVKMHTFDFGCPPISVQQHQIFKILVSPHYQLSRRGRHKNFEHHMLLSLDMRKSNIQKCEFLMCHALPIISDIKSLNHRLKKLAG
jgi:hypothetical protein